MRKINLNLKIRFHRINATFNGSSSIYCRLDLDVISSVCINYFQHQQTEIFLLITSGAWPSLNGESQNVQCHADARWRKAMWMNLLDITESGLHRLQKGHLYIWSLHYDFFAVFVHWWLNQPVKWEYSLPCIHFHYGS